MVIPGQAKAAFEQYAIDAGLQLASATPEMGIRTMIAFYAEHSAEGCDTEPDSDMLLYQWGEFHPEDGGMLYLDITRQFILLPDEEDHKDITQLGLSFIMLRLPADPLELGPPNRWCRSRAELPEFQGYIQASASFALLGQRRPARVTLDYQEVC